MMLDVDQAVHAAFNDHVIPGYDLFFYAITMMGSAYLWIVILLVSLLIGKWKMIAAVLLITLAFGMMVNDDTKDVVKRERPDNAVVGSYFSGHNYSFPSGHTQTAFTVATVLSAFVAWRYRPLLFLLASAVGISRLYLDVHYFTDVIGGAATGTMLGVMSIYGLYWLGLYGKGHIAGKMIHPAEKSVEKRMQDASMIKAAAAVLATGFIAALILLLLSHYVLSLVAIGVTYFALIILPFVISRYTRAGARVAP